MDDNEAVSAIYTVFEDLVEDTPLRCELLTLVAPFALISRTQDVCTIDLYTIDSDKNDELDPILNGRRTVAHVTS